MNHMRRRRIIDMNRYTAFKTADFVNFFLEKNFAKYFYRKRKIPSIGILKVLSRLMMKMLPNKKKKRKKKKMMV